jgi:ABC-type uncharacterized transport system permease subunit
MRAVSTTFRFVAAMILALVVAGFMLAFINQDAHDFFVAVFVAPLGLIFEGMSHFLGPRHS